MTLYRGKVGGELLTDKVLETARILSGLNSDDTSFDVEIITYGEMVISELHELGAIPIPISIDTNTQWSDICSDRFRPNVKVYFTQSIRLQFDPPQTSYQVSALLESNKRLRWLIKTMAEEDE